MALENAVDYFVNQEKILASMSLAFGKRQSDSSFVGSSALAGIVDETAVPVDENTVYDLASLTKLFTGIMVEMLYADGKLQPEDKIKEVVPQFKNLDASVNQVLSFQVPIKTDGRIDRVETATQGRNVLFTAAVHPESAEERRYSDIHSMVLKYVLEAAAGEKYFDFAKKRILMPLGMTSTFAHVPESEIFRVCSYDSEYRIENGKRVCRRSRGKGIPHDPKAALLQGRSDDVPGHAGLFSTLSDMCRLCRGLVEEKLISRERLLSMGENRTGRIRQDGTYSQYLGCQCYVKHPVQYFSEIPTYMSDKAIGLSGFTGNHISIDAEKGIYVVMLGNRVMNRLTMVTPSSEIEKIGLSSEGRGTVKWNDGISIVSSVNYVHLKDKYMHSEIEKELIAIDD